MKYESYKERLETMFHDTGIRKVFLKKITNHKNLKPKQEPDWYKNRKYQYSKGKMTY